MTFSVGGGDKSTSGEAVDFMAISTIRFRCCYRRGVAEVRQVVQQQGENCDVETTMANS